MKNSSTIIKHNDIERYQDTLKNLILTLGVNQYGSFLRSIFLFKEIQHTSFYQVFKNDYFSQHANENEKFVIPLYDFKMFCDQYLKDDFKKETLLIWLNKITDKNIINNYESILKGNLENLRNIGINNVFLINDEINDRLNGIILSLNIKSADFNSLKTNVCHLIKEGFYINENNLNSLFVNQQAPIFEEYIEKNKENEIQYNQYYLNSILSEKNNIVKKTKI